MKIDAIKIGRRHRKDMGDIDGLAANIAEVGLLHPVVVTPGGQLVAGERRIQAFRKLGRSEIPATVIDLDRVVRGEYAENFFRKAFSPSEMVAIADAIEATERVKAKERQIEGGRTAGRGRPRIGSGNFPEPTSPKGNALDHVAKVVGKDRKTVAKARTVVQAAKAEPERFRKIQEDMDRTGNVERAHKAVKVVQKRAQFDAEIAAKPTKPLDTIKVVHADCLAHLRQMDDASVDVIVTSPPYNIGVAYETHKDDMPREAYLAWLHDVAVQLRRIMRPDASFFLNIGSTSKDPWIEADVGRVMRQTFCLQNHIVWVKAIAVNGKMIGHFKPVSSDRYLNRNSETIFHLTLRGDVKIDRLGVGVPFGDKSNIERIGHAHDLHCAGNVWFISYDTVQSSTEKFQHPAGFPVELAERCIKLHGLRAGLAVLDPFLGSGTTLVAAQRLGCTGTGIEVDEYYAKIAAVRLGGVADAA
jgi:site-specific DNA-methyltransferase (adenine-specific)